MSVFFLIYHISTTPKTTIFQAKQKYLSNNLQISKIFCTIAAKIDKKEKIMAQKQTITKAEIAEHFVSVDRLHEDLTNLVHNFYAKTNTQRMVI